MPIDLKAYGRLRAWQRALDELATTLAWITATVLLLFYVLGFAP